MRDTALGHVLALEKDAAGGQRIITASGACPSQSDLFSDSYIDHIGGYNWQEWSMLSLPIRFL